MRYRLFDLLGVMLLAALGCEAPPRSVPVPVTGKVTMDGSPVERAQIVFLNRVMEGRPAIAITDKHGSFSLTTRLGPRNSNERQGALPGEYDVIIIKEPSVGGTYYGPWGRTSTSEPENVLPEKYSKPGCLEARVNEGEANEFVFNLDVDA